MEATQLPQPHVTVDGLMVRVVLALAVVVGTALSVVAVTVGL